MPILVSKTLPQWSKEQARLRNHPNVLAATQPSSRKPKGREHRRLPETDADPTRRVLKTGLDGKNDPKKDLELGEEKYCHYHLRKGHLLA